MFKAIATTLVLGVGAIGVLAGCGGHDGGRVYRYEEPYFYNEPDYVRPFYYRDGDREFREFHGRDREFDHDDREFHGPGRDEFHGGEHFGGGEEHGRR